MAKPLLIEVERPTYAVGETVRGTVMAVEGIDKAKDLTVELIHSGKRTGDESVAKVTLLTGPVPADASFPFEIPIPLAVPFSFVGHAHQAEWKAKVSADVPWAIDPKAEQALEVTPMRVPNDPEAIAEVVGSRAAEEPGKTLPKWVGWLILLIFGPLIFGLAAFMLPFILYWIVKSKLINTRLKDYKLEIPDRPMLLGEWVPVAVRFELKKAIALERLKLHLRGVEKWTTGSGKNSTTHYHYFYDQEISELPETILAVSPGARGSEAVVRSAVQLPLDGMPCLGTGSVYYELKATAEIKGWPDPSATEKIPVLGATLETEGTPPPAVPVKESSRDVIVLATGERPPLGVDISTAMGAIWLWLFMPVLGLGLGIGGLFAHFEGIATVEGVPVLLVAGAAILVLGLLGLFAKIFR